MTTIVVSTGTYFRPFDRLIDWLEPWASIHPDVAFTVQHGPGHPLPGATNSDFLAFEDLASQFDSADIVVLQGGAGGVMDAREHGRVPIVVPRLPGGGEVVDDHQLLFCRRAASLGLVYCAESAAELYSLLAAAIAGRIPTRVTDVEPTPGSSRLAALLSAPFTPLAVSGRRSRLARSLRLLFRPSSVSGRNAAGKNAAGKNTREASGKKAVEDTVNPEARSQ